MVGKEFKALRRAVHVHFFASLPPTEALRLMVSRGVSAETERRAQPTGGDKAGEAIELMLLDVRRAHFYARAIRRVFVNMPPEDACQGIIGDWLHEGLCIPLRVQA